MTARQASSKKVTALVRRTEDNERVGIGQLIASIPRMFRMPVQQLHALAKCLLSRADKMMGKQ